MDSKQLQFDKSYLKMAGIWARNSYCVRRQVGALIVKDRSIISDGYNGTPCGFENVCEDEQGCTKPYVLHAEANAIISASRDKMLGSSMYLAGTDAKTGEYIANSNSCSMCKRMIINAGIEKVYVRDDKDHYRMVEVNDWIINDESLEGTLGY